MIREIFEKEFSHGNSSPPCSVFFCVVFAGTAGSYYLLTSLLIPSVHPGTTLDARDPRTARFSNQHRSRCHFPRLWISERFRQFCFFTKRSTLLLEKSRKINFLHLFLFFPHLSPQSPSTFHRFLYSTPLSNIWTLGTGYLPSNSLPDLWVEGRYTGVHRQWVDRLFQAFR